jgi:hypothetical protein
MTRDQKASPVVRGLATLWLLAIAPAGCHRSEAPPRPGGPSASSPSAATGGPAAGDGGGAAGPRTGASNGTAPFIHDLLSRAANKPSHADCSPGALARVTEQVRSLQARAAIDARAGKGRKSDVEASCASDAAAQRSQQIKGELLDRAAGCVGQDGPLDAEWDMVNSGLLSLGVCLDCRRTPGERAADCKRSREIIARAEKSAHASVTGSPAPK